MRSLGAPSVAVAEKSYFRAAPAGAPAARVSVPAKPVDFLGAAYWMQDLPLPGGLAVDPATGTVGGPVASPPRTLSGLTVGAFDLRDGAEAYSNPFAVVMAGALTATAPASRMLEKDWATEFSRPWRRT